MSTERWIRFVAGSFVLISLGLGQFVSAYFRLFTLFVGANLVQSALTGFCPLTFLLRALGAGDSPAPKVQR